MKAYKIQTCFNYGETHLVIADNMAEAERIFLGKYWPVDIKSIELISNYVQIQKYDEQKKER